MNLLNLLATYSSYYTTGDSYSYSTGLSAGQTAAAAGGIAALFGILMLPSIIIAVVSLIGMWKVYTKLGIAGWKCIIPFYNLWVLFEALGMAPWLSLVSLIPIVGGVLALIAIIIAYIRLAKGFGKEGAWVIGLVLLTPIFMLILGFGKDTWNPALLAGAPNIFAPNNAQPAAGASAQQAAPQQDAWVAGQDENKQA